MADTAIDINALAAAITAAVAEASPVKQVHISRYKAETPWNPTGERHRPALNGNFFQNGVKIRPDFITDKDVALLNKLKPGRYVDRKLEVIERIENNERNVEIRYSNASSGQRMELKNHFRNFTEMLELLVGEQKPAAAATK